MGVQSSLLLWTLVVEPHGLPSPGVGDTFASSFPAPVASPFLHKLFLGGNTLSSYLWR